jgi:hypothetical protein
VTKVTDLNPETSASRLVTAGTALERRSQNGRVQWERMQRLIRRWLPPEITMHRANPDDERPSLACCVGHDGFYLCQLVGCYSVKSKSEVVGLYELHASRQDMIESVSTCQQMSILQRPSNGHLGSDLLPENRTQPDTIFVFRSGSGSCRRAGTRRRRSSLR